MYIYIYIYICMYVCIYIHIYIHTYIYRVNPAPFTLGKRLAATRGNRRVGGHWVVDPLGG